MLFSVVKLPKHMNNFPDSTKFNNMHCTYGVDSCMFMILNETGEPKRVSVNDD